MTAPNKKEIAPILFAAGFFVLTTYGTIHNFILPRSEAEAAIVNTNKRVDQLEAKQERDRLEIFQAIRDIQSYILGHR